MRPKIQRVLTAIMAFTLGIGSTSAIRFLVRRVGGNAGSRVLIASLDGAIRGDPNPDRFVKLGNLPPHDDDETDGFNCEFIDDKVGWLANGARLWRTTDGGASWSLVYDRGKVNWLDPNFIDHVKFANGDLGWVLADNKLQRTNDSGKTWTSIAVPKAGHFTTFDFLPDGKTGWLGGSVCEKLGKNEGAPNRFYCGDPKSAANAAVFVTHDAGRTWHRQFVSSSIGHIGYLAMRDSHHGLAIGQARVLRYTGGRWLGAESLVPELENPEVMPGEYCLEVSIGMPTYCPVNFHFTNNHHGLISNANGYFGRTNDGGRTWIDISRCAAEGRHLDPVYFSKFYLDEDGWGIALDSDGGLQETFDGGVTWKALTKGAFTNLFALDTKRIWLISDDGIYRLADETTAN